jgi:hypothetical protein
LVLRLTAPFIGLGRESQREVRDDDSRFDFVAMLATGTAAAKSANLALGEQVGDGETGGMRNHGPSISAALALANS